MANTTRPRRVLATWGNTLCKGPHGTLIGVVDVLDAGANRNQVRYVVKRAGGAILYDGPNHADALFAYQLLGRG